MYLLFLKALSKIFWILTVINIPIIYIYASGHENKDNNFVSKLFGHFTIGNIGETGMKCFQKTLNFDQDEISLSCGQGYFSKIVSAGFVKNNE